MGGPVFRGRGRGLQLSERWAALGVYEVRAVVVRAKGPRGHSSSCGGGATGRWRTVVEALKSSFMVDLTEDLTEASLAGRAPGGRWSPRCSPKWARVVERRGAMSPSGARYSRVWGWSRAGRGQARYWSLNSVVLAKEAGLLPQAPAGSKDRADPEGWPLESVWLVWTPVRGGPGGWQAGRAGGLRGRATGGRYWELWSAVLSKGGASRGGGAGLQPSLPATGGPGGQTLSLLVVANSALLTLRLSRGRRGWTLSGLSHAWRSSVGRTMASFVS